MCTLCTLHLHVHIVHITFACAHCAHTNTKYNVHIVHIIFSCAHCAHKRCAQCAHNVHIDVHKMCSKLTLTAVASSCSRVKEGPVVKFRRAAENTKQRKHRRKKDTKCKKGLSHRDAFRSCSRVSSSGRTGREKNWKTRIEEKDRFNQQQGT